MITTKEMLLKRTRREPRMTKSCVMQAMETKRKRTTTSTMRTTTTTTRIASHYRLGASASAEDRLAMNAADPNTVNDQYN